MVARLDTPPGVHSRSVRDVLLSWTESAAESMREFYADRYFLRVASVLLFVYFNSTALTWYNKYLFADFRFPITVTMIHMFSIFGLSYLIGRKLLGREWLPSDIILRKIVPIGMATGLDYALSNESFLYITVTWYTMVKSGVPLFMLLFSFAMGVERVQWKLIFMIALISTGIIVATEGQTEFNLTGFLLVLCASILAGFRLVLAQVLLHGRECHVDALTMLMHMTPVCGLTLLPVSIAVDRGAISSSPYIHDWSGIMELFLKLGAGVLLAFLLNLSEFLGIQQLSALTLSVAGIFKEMVVVAGGVLIFGDKLNMTNALGFGITLLGILWFNYYKLKKRSKTLDKAAVDHDGYESLTKSVDQEWSEDYDDVSKEISLVLDDMDVEQSK